MTVFTDGEWTGNANEPSVPVPQFVTVNGADRPIEQDETTLGRDRSVRSHLCERESYGPAGDFCSNCTSTDIAADGLDCIECVECGNIHCADKWDDSYL